MYCPFHRSSVLSLLFIVRNATGSSGSTCNPYRLTLVLAQSADHDRQPLLDTSVRSCEIRCTVDYSIITDVSKQLDVSYRNAKNYLSLPMELRTSKLESNNPNIRTSLPLQYRFTNLLEITSAQNFFFGGGGVADLGCSVNHVKLLISSCLHNLCS